MQDLFYQVVGQFQSANQYDKFIKEAVREYDIKNYRFHLFSLEHAKHVYNQLNERYLAGLLQRQSCGWNEHERRLFIWFILCYINLKILDPVKLADGEKHWKHIANVFWSKNTLFLRYQLHTIIKIKGKTVWKPTDDDLLKAVFCKHAKGEWNQIAKDVYFMSKGTCFKAPKQCRERWQNHLNNEISRGDWNKQEQRIILQQVKQHGKKWARIVPLLKGTRTEHMIKNKFKALLHKEMQESHLGQAQAIEVMLLRTNEDSNQTKHNNKPVNKPTEGKVQGEVKKQEKPLEQQDQIKFVQSLDVEESEQQPKKKRGRPKKVEADQDEGQVGRKKPNPLQQNSISKNRNLQKIGQFEGCIVLGPEMPHIQQYFLNSQNSMSQFGQSNSFFRSAGPEALYNSGRYLMNNSLRFPYEDKSLMGLDQSTVKSESSSRLEVKRPQNASLRSFESIIVRNESFISKLINS